MSQVKIVCPKCGSDRIVKNRITPIEIKTITADEYIDGLAGPSVSFAIYRRVEFEIKCLACRKYKRRYSIEECGD